MKLIAGWRVLLRRSWSFRLALLSAVLSAIEFAVPFFAPEQRSGMFALAAGGVSLAAALARLVAQPKMLELLGIEEHK